MSASDEWTAVQRNEFADSGTSEYVKPRATVSWFAQLIERYLREEDDRGKRRWLYSSPEVVIAQIEEGISLLRERHEFFDDSLLTQRDAVKVAALCVMLADVVTVELEETTPTTGTPTTKEED